jgi:hypothetical protein
VGFDPFNRPDLSPEEKRRITEPKRLPRQDEPVDIGPDVAREVFNDYARIANKAKALADSVETEAQKYTIPVGEFATEVRAAITRKDQFTSDGSVITFDLFKDAISQMEKRRNLVSLDSMAQNITGNALADSKYIDSQMMAADNPDLDAEKLAMLASNFMILYILNQMQGPWKAIDTQQMTAGKLPPSTEIGGLIAQTIIGIIMQLLVAGLQEAAIEGFLKRSGVEQLTGRDPKSFIAQAKGAKLDEMQDLAQRKMGEGDYELILDYAKDFLAQTPLAGYESWVAYWEAREIRQTAMSTWRGAPQYSTTHALARYQGWPDRRSHQGDAEEDLDLAGAVDVSLRNAIAASVDTVAPEYMCTLNEQADALDKGLNMIGQVAATRVTRDALCCLVRYFGKIGDPKMLRALRASLKVLLAIQGKIGHVSLSNFAGNFLDFLEEEIKIQLRDLMNRFVDKVFGPVEDFLFEPDDKEWQVLFSCPLIEDMVNQVIRLSVELRFTMRDFLDGFVVDFKSGEKERTERWATIYQGKKLRTILMVLEQVLKALEHGNLCDEEDEIGQDQIFVDITNDVPEMPAVEIPPEVVAEHFPDSEPIEITFSRGAVEIRDTIPSMKDPQIQIGDVDGDVEVRCRKTFGSILEDLGSR